MTAAAIAAAAIAVPASAGAQAHVAKHKHKHKHHKTATVSGPSLTVLGFGVNHLFVADGATVSDGADCSTAVQGNGYLDGPPQNVYFNVYVKAVDVPASTPVQYAYSYPEGEGVGDEQPTLAAAVPFSTLASSSLLFGYPPDTKDVYRIGLSSGDDANGPSASDFNGQYMYEVSADLDGKTVTSTATATVNCPYG
jgi:hypothetical protein